MKKLTSITLLLVFLASFFVNGQSDQGQTATEIDTKINEVLDDKGMENAETQIQENIGKLPDESGYGLKIALEKIKLALTFKRERRAELELKLANKRLEEAKLMAEKNELKGLMRAREEHKKLVQKIKKDLKNSGEDEKDLEKQNEIEDNLNEQENKIDTIENSILIRAKGLNEDQKKELIELVNGFKSETSDVKIKINEDKEELITRLKAKGITEEQIKEKEERLGKNIERFANHQIQQSEKMLNLANELINKAQNEKNITIKQETLDLKKKAQEKLDEAKKTLTEKKYKESVLIARESKKLSALTIVSIRGNPEIALERAKNLEELSDLREQKLEDMKRLKEERDKLKEEYKEKIKDIKEDKLKNLANIEYTGVINKFSSTLELRLKSDNPRVRELEQEIINKLSDGKFAMSVGDYKKVIEVSDEIKKLIMELSEILNKEERK